MEDKSTRRTYLHDATAIATSGRIGSPFEELIPTQGALALPASGGYGSSRVDGFRYKEILSFGAAYTEVAGASGGKDGPFETLSVAVVEKLNILDVVTCDRVVARLASILPVDGHEPSFTTAGTRFERLRIGSRFWEELDLGGGMIADYSTWTKLRNALGDEATGAKLGKFALAQPDGNKVPLPKGPQMPGMLGFSLCPDADESLKEGASSKAEGSSGIHVEQFGVVHLGQLYITQYSRQLLMLRLELGCPVKGTAGGPGVKSGGNPFPP